MKPQRNTQGAHAERASSQQRPPHARAAAVAQRKESAPSAQARTSPAAPPAYRPQPLQKCLQPKKAVPTATPHAHAHARVTTPQNAARPDSQQQHARPTPKTAAAQQHTQQQHAAQARAAAAVRPPATKPCAQKTLQRKAAASRVIQAVKLYPNLHPGAVERIEQDSVYKLSNFADQYRLRKTQSHGVYVPNQLYNFVRTSEGEMLLHNRYRHPSIAEGRQVLYAGEAYFNNGKLEWWSNGSGHYQPDSEDAQQAALPMEQFFSYQQVLKGEHKRRKG